MDSFHQDRSLLIHVVFYYVLYEWVDFLALKRVSLDVQVFFRQVRVSRISFKNLTALVGGSKQDWLIVLWDVVSHNVSYWVSAHDC